MAVCERVLLSRPVLALSKIAKSSSCMTPSHRVAIASNVYTKFNASRTSAPLFSGCQYASFHSSVPRHNEHIVNIQDDEDFKAKVLQSKTPVIVDFHATWCGPCKLLGPRLEALVSAKQGKVILAKIDIDDHSELAIKHGVEAVPTVIAMKNGKQVEKFVGLKDDANLKSFVDKLIGA